MDWAKHRRRKAAAKMHLRLTLQTFLPCFAVIEEAEQHDSRGMGALCATLQAGEIAVFEKAYVQLRPFVRDDLARRFLGHPGFLGHSKQAIRWQLWAALLLYVLVRFQHWTSRWPHSFTRFFPLIRGILWDQFDLAETLQFYETAGDKWRMRSQPETAYLPGFSP